MSVVTLDDSKLKSFPLWQKAVLFGAAYFLCAEASNWLSVRHGVFMTFWLPAGLYVGVLLLNPTRDWPWLCLAAFPANLAFDLIHGTPLIPIFIFYFANTLQSVTGAWLVRRFVAERPTMATLKEFIGLMGFAALFSTMLGAAVTAAMLVHFGMSQSFVQSFKLVWGDCAMAVLVFTPFLLAWFSRQNPARNLLAPPKKIAEAVLLFLGLSGYLWYLLAVETGVMSPDKSLGIPFLLWAGLRFGTRGATATILFLSLALAFFTTQFFSGLTSAQIASGEYVFILQMLLAMLALVTLIPAIVLDERNRTLAELRESEEKFSTAFRASPDGICITELESGRFLEVNDSYCKLFHYTRKELVGRSAVELGIFADADTRRRFLDAVLAQGSVRDMELTTHRSDGQTRLIQASAERMELGTKQCIVSVIHDITEREQAIRREQSARVEYTFQLIASQEAERTRIARELHDSLGQNLLLIKNHALLARTDDNTAGTRLEEISALAAQAIAEVRQISHDLHPYQLDHLGLTRALTAMIDSAAEASGIAFEHKLDSVDNIFSTDAATNLYRIVQEAVNNILKHSRAKKVSIKLECDVREVQLHIEDDGCGFKTDNGGKGIGLKNIAERARILNGTLKVASQPGRGTRIEVTIPIAEAA